MSGQAYLSRIRLELDHAMSLVPNDRWVMGSLREGRLRVLADSSPERDRPFGVYDAAVAGLVAGNKGKGGAAAANGDAAIGINGAAIHARGCEGHVSSPALVYAPVGVPGRRPVGLLTVGCLADHWYRQDEIDYVAGVAMSFTSAVLSLDGPLARLGSDERAAARLLGQGLSVAELAAALELDGSEARELVSSVLRKLSLRSPRELANLWPELTSLAT